MTDSTVYTLVSLIPSASVHRIAIV